MRRKANGRTGPIWTCVVLLSIAVGLAPLSLAYSQPADPETDEGSERLKLDRAVMCEEVRELAPFNVSVVFSVEIGKVSCFTLFDPVPKKTFVYHTWFHRDRESTRKRLALRPPRWSTVSSIQLREADKGPWRVVISDDTGHIFAVMRFSVTD
jgi:hypothetical protein